MTFENKDTIRPPLPIGQGDGMRAPVNSAGNLDLPNSLDLMDDFNRIANLIRVLAMTVQHPTSDDDHALAEMYWTLRDRCEVFADDLKALAAKERVAS